MSNRPYRQTSSEAHESIKEYKEAIYQKILASFERIKVGATSEEVAFESGLEYAQCHKRIAELVQSGKLYNIGTTRKNKSGRSAMIRQLSEFRPKQPLKQAELFNS